MPKTGLKNALLRDNLYMMGAACFPCAREHTPVDAFDLGALARASTVRWRSRLSESSAVRFDTQYLLECFRGSYSIRQEFLAGRKEVRADIPCQEYGETLGMV